MGQAANTGRNASLDQKKRRAAGRQKANAPEQQAIQDFQGPGIDKGKTGGAHGRAGKANPSGQIGAASGGGGAGSLSARAKASHLTTPRSTRPARKRKA